MSVSIDASCDPFLYYSGGVFDVGCGTNNNNHAVTLVGYNSDLNNEHGVAYWIAKNSWSKNWGVKGYMYIAMDLVDSSSGGTCGICNLLTQPLGVNPKNATSFVNTTYPSPDIDDDDDTSECQHVTVFGKSVGGSSDSTLCDVIIWLASPHSVLTWVLAFVITAVATFLLSAILRKCYRCLCCSKDEEGRNSRRSR